MKLITFAVLALISSVSAQRGPLFNSTGDRRIVGGMEIYIEEAPYQASLMSKAMQVHICGAVIVTNKFVLTAAHCVRDRKAGDLSVRVGSTKKDEGGVVHEIAVIRVHPYFNKVTYDYDIAVLQLTVDIKIDDRTTQEIVMADYGEILPEGTPVLVSGWGEECEF